MMNNVRCAAGCFSAPSRVPFDGATSPSSADIIFIRITNECARREGLEGLLSSLPSYTYIEDRAEADEVIALFSKLERRLFSKSEDSLTALRASALFLDILYRLHKICDKEYDSKNT